MALLPDPRNNRFSESGLEYVVNDDSMRRPFEAPPVVVNYFYHEQINVVINAKKQPCYRVR